MVQWLGLHTSLGEAQVQSLVGELRHPFPTPRPPPHVYTEFDLKDSLFFYPQSWANFKRR